MRPIAVAVLFAVTALAAPSAPRFPAARVAARGKLPALSYRLHVDTTDLSAIQIELHVAGGGDTIRLAMAAHPEYDDRYWRYIEALSAASGDRTLPVLREDSAVWRVVTRGGDAIVRYRLRLPPASAGPRAAWRPFLAPTGGLLGGPHMLMYLLGATDAPARLTLELPAGWTTATGLVPSGDAKTFRAPDAFALIDSPLLVGRLHVWRFAVRGVPHRVVYWSESAALPFDSGSLVRSIERISRQSAALFGGLPYASYTFLLQDDAYGALEHANSVTLGAPGAELAADPSGILQEIAHEYFHTWNLVRIRPVEYGGLDYRPPPPVAGLWWSEGVTMLYADLLLRRAGLASGEPTRAAHVAGLISRYFSSAGNQHFSAERISEAEYDPNPAALGDYTASVHLQGELIGTLIDLAVRDATDGRRSLDDVMRLVFRRFGGKRGFDGRGIQRAVTEVCRCDVGDLFAGAVRGARPLDFDRYLRRVGLRTRISRSAERDRQGHPAPDLRIYARRPRNGGALQLVITDPASVWGRAGLHTGDEVTAVNGRRVATWPEFRSVLATTAIGDTVRLAVAHGGRARDVAVVVGGYQRAEARIENMPDATARMRRLRKDWAAAAPTQ